MSVLAVEALDVRRGGRAIVSGCSFHAERGEIVAIMGPSGAGKTTILRALAGLDPIAAGRITVPRPVGMVFQFHHLFANMTAHKNVWLAPVHVLKRPLAEAERRASELLASLGGHAARAVGRRSAARARSRSSLRFSSLTSRPRPWIPIGAASWRRRSGGSPTKGGRSWSPPTTRISRAPARTAC